MKVEIKINKELEEPLITIETSQLTNEINKLVDYINSSRIDLLVGIVDEKLEVINEDEIVKIIAQEKKNYAITETKKYWIKSPLYEIEKRLGKNFIRISHSEIINAKKIKSIDMSFTGTI
ncbi:LytTR family DNA-binding domain-containing protein [Streptococcus halichoeri]|uniref:LytTR family DNA-binding domain-containing protein n=1 Tax=Streptococcus halichoeri TaxID=254785 RepID=UPI0019174DC3|nr:LytTR family DNA-binding domain-containing protein [Streptococcus halichoeri]